MRLDSLSRLSKTIVLAPAIVLSTIGTATAQENGIDPARKEPPAPVRLQGPIDSAELEAFLDELIRREMGENHIVGAAVSVVKDGALFLAKGYGFADLENKIPVDAERTVFKIGSVTKLFTWTAVMQLVEQGKLNLEADVNTYLDFHIPDTYSQPITLRHLLTHTAGFEDLHVDMVTLKEENLVPLREWLVSHIPARIYPPGELAAYSNYGAALAGHIVARVSGESYSRYVQQHILNPLGMNSSTARWPVPSDLSARESAGYVDTAGAFRVFPSLMSPADLLPAGGMRSTVTDMARFMIAHLQDGRYNDETISETRILEEATARRMHSTLHTHDSRLLGTAYGFFDFSDNGRRTIGHSGEAEPMESLLLLLPDRNLGVFVSYNSMGGAKLTRQHFGFQREFFDHYFPAPALKPISPPAGFGERADRFAGVYKMTRKASTTLERFMSLANPTVEVKNPGDGTLLLFSPYGDWRIVEEGPLVFRQMDGPFRFAFREDARGRIAWLFTDLTPMLAFEKSPWYETPGFNLPLLLVCLLIFLAMLLVAVIGAIRKHRPRLDRNPEPRAARAAYRLILGISALNLMFVAGNMLWGERIAFGIPLITKIVLGLGVLSALLTVGATVYAVLVWKRGYWRVAFRAFYTLGTIAAIVFVWFLNHWNLLGWQY